MASHNPTQHKNLSNTVISLVMFSTPNASHANKVTTHPSHREANRTLLCLQTHTHRVQLTPTPYFSSTSSQMASSAEKFNSW